MLFSGSTRILASKALQQRGDAPLVYDAKVLLKGRQALVLGDLPDFMHGTPPIAAAVMKPVCPSASCVDARVATKTRAGCPKSQKASPTASAIHIRYSTQPLSASAFGIHFTKHRFVLLQNGHRLGKHGHVFIVG
jgi:hypothetical protein